MKPLGMVAIGLLIVAADLRFDGFDLIPDVIGWCLVMGGLIRLTDRSRWFTVAAVAAPVELVLAVPQVLLVQYGVVVSAVDTAFFALVVFGTCSGIRDVVADGHTRSTADRLRWIMVALSLIGILLTVLAEPVQVTGGATIWVVLGVLVALAYYFWLLGFLWVHRNDPVLGSQRVATEPQPVR